MLPLVENEYKRNVKLDAFIAVGLLAITGLIRSYGINQWAITGDEYFTMYKSHERFTSLVNPAYYALVVLFYELFGTSEWIARLPALLMSVTSVPVLYLCWSRLIGRETALIASIILIFSAWHLWFSQFARFYSGIFLFSVLAYYFFYAALVRDKISDLIIAFVCSLAGILFHVTFVFVPISCAAFYFFAFLLQLKSVDNIFSKRILLIYLSLCLIAALPILPFLIGILSRWTGTGQIWGYGPLAIVFQVVKYVQLPIVATSLFGLILGFYWQRKLTLFLAAGIVIPLIMLILASSFISVKPDYVFYILPLIIILAATACRIARQSISDTNIGAYVLPFVLVTTLLPEFASHFSSKASLHFRDSVQFVEQNFEEGDRVLSMTIGFNHYTKEKVELEPFISFERDNSIDWNKELSAKVDADHRLWILLSKKRQAYAPRLEHWLRCNASLVKRNHARRFDYEVDGHEVYLADVNSLNKQLHHCKN